MNQLSSGNISGLSAIALWSFSAPLMAYTQNGFPPILLAALVGCFGFLVFAAVWLFEDTSFRSRLAFPPAIIGLALIGIGGYRLMLFLSFQSAPPAEASLLNYLWPLLTILFPSVLASERLKLCHVAGALISFAGLVVLLFEDDAGFADIQAGHWLALGAAVWWAGFSVLSRITKAYSSDVVPTSFILSAGIFYVLHLLFEGDAPIVAGPWEWLSAITMGVTAGASYFLWDRGVKHGSIQMLATTSYFLPVFSTSLMIAFGQAQMTRGLAIAALLVFFGSVVAGWDKISVESRINGRRLRS